MMRCTEIEGRVFGTPAALSASRLSRRHLPEVHVTLICSVGIALSQFCKSIGKEFDEWSNHHHIAHLQSSIQSNYISKNCATARGVAPMPMHDEKRSKAVNHRSDVVHLRSKCYAPRQGP